MTYSKISAALRRMVAFKALCLPGGAQIVHSRGAPGLILASVAMLPMALGLAGCSSGDSSTPEIVNPSAPSSAITSPAPGAFMHAGTTADMDITVSGEICDPVNPVTSFVLNGMGIPLTGGGDCRSFSTSLNSTWGLNVLKGLTANDVGNEIALVQSYLRSGEFFAPTMASRRSSTKADAIAGIPNAFRARLTQAAIDDGDRSDNDDLVTVLNTYMGDLAAVITSSLNNAMPNPIYSTVHTIDHECLLQTRHNREGVLFRANGSVNIGTIRINELTATNGGLVVDFRIGPVTVPLAVAGFKDDGCLGELSASGTGTVGVQTTTIRATISVDNDGNIQVGINNVSLGNAIVDVELNGLIGWFDGFISGALSFLGSAFLDLIEPTLVDVMRNNVAPLIGDFVGMNVFTMGDWDGDILGVTLVLDAQTDVVDVRSGYIDYGVTANAHPAVYTKTSEQLAAGTIIGSSTLPVFTGMNGSFGLGLKIDFINQVFWALWAGGAFDFAGASDAALDSLNARVSVPGVTITSMEMTLPPVLMPGDTASEVRIGVGGIVLSANIEQSSPTLIQGQPVITVNVPLTIHVAVFFTATIGLTPDGSLDFLISHDAEVEVQIVDAVRTPQIVALEAEVGSATGALLEGLIRRDVGWRIALPELPLGSATWYLANGVLDQAAGYVRIIGSVGVRD